MGCGRLSLEDGQHNTYVLTDAPKLLVKALNVIDWTRVSIFQPSLGNVAVEMGVEVGVEVEWFSSQVWMIRTLSNLPEEMG